MRRWKLTGRDLKAFGSGRRDIHATAGTFGYSQTATALRTVIQSEDTYPTWMARLQRFPYSGKSGRGRNLGMLGHACTVACRTLG